MVRRVTKRKMRKNRVTLRKSVFKVLPGIKRIADPKLNGPVYKTAPAAAIIFGAYPD